MAVQAIAPFFADADADSPTGDDGNDLLDLSAGAGMLIGGAYGGGNDDPGTVNFYDAAGNLPGSLTFSNNESVIPCVAPGWLIGIDQGNVPVKDLLPVCIAKSATGEWISLRDMLVTPQHRLPVTGPGPKRWFGVDEVLVTRRSLTALEAQVLLAV